MEEIQASYLKLKKKVPKMEIIKAKLISEKFSKIHGKIQQMNWSASTMKSTWRERTGFLRRLEMKKNWLWNELETAHEKTTYNEVKGLLKLIKTKESENPKNPKIPKSAKGPSEPSNGLKEDLVECFKITLQMKWRKERKIIIIKLYCLFFMNILIIITKNLFN